MSVSKYNGNEPFNPALFLYLNPELQIQNNLLTVEDAYVYYTQNSNDPSLLWSLSYLPETFNSERFLTENRDILDISGLNRTIKNAMLLDNITTEELNAESKFVPTIFKNVQLIKDNQFQFNEVQISSKQIQKGDLIEIIHQHQIYSIIAEVTKIFDVDATTTIYTTDVTEEYIPHSFNDPDIEYKVTGIRLYDYERLATIHYLRYLNKNDIPPPKTSLMKSKFNPELYKLLYPQARILDNETAFVDYVNRSNSNEMSIIGNTTDLLELATDCNRTNYFEEVHISNRLILNFDTDTGFFRMNNKNIYYFTTDTTRTSKDINPYFPGLVSEHAIKTYVDQKYDIEATFKKVNITGNIKLTGDSNYITNSYIDKSVLTNSTFEGNTTFQGSNGQTTIFNIATTFNSNVVFNGDLIIASDINIDNKLTTHDIVNLSNNTFAYGTFESLSDFICQSNVYLNGDTTSISSLLASNSLFYGQSTFSNTVDFTSNVNFYNDVHFDHGKINVNTIMNVDTLNLNSNAYVKGDISFEKDSSVNFHTSPHFNTEITIDCNLNVHGKTTFSNTTNFYGNVSFFDHTSFENIESLYITSENLETSNLLVADAIFVGKVNFESNTYFEGDSYTQNASTSNLIVNNEAIFIDGITSKNTSYFDNLISDDFIVQSNALFLGIVDFTHDTTFQSNVSFSDTVDFNGKTYFKDLATFCNLQVLKDIEIQNDLLVLGNFNVATKSYFNSETYFNDNTYFNSNVSFHARTIFDDTTIFNTDTVFNSNISCSNTIDAKHIHGENMLIYGDNCTISADCLFSTYGPTRFLNDVAFLSNISFPNDILVIKNIYTSNEGYIEKLTANEIISGTSTFNDEARFMSNAHFNDLAEFTHLVSSETHLRGTTFVSGNITFDGFIKLNNNLKVNAITTYEGVVDFNQTVNFNNNSIFNQNVQYNARSVFNKPVDYFDFVTFNDSINAEGEATFQDKVIFMEDVTFGRPLQIEDIIVNHITASNMRVIDESEFNGTLKVKKDIYFESDSTLTGDICFSNCQLEFKDDAHFFKNVYLHGKNSFINSNAFENNTYFTDNVSFHQANVTFDNTNFIVNNGSIDVNAGASFNSNVTFTDLVDVRNNITFHEDIQLSNNDIIGNATFHDHLIIKSVSLCNTTIDDLVSLTSANFLGSVYFNKDVFLNNSFTSYKNCTFNGKLEVNDISTFNHNAYFKSNVEIDSLFADEINNNFALIHSLEVDQNVTLTRNCRFVSEGHIIAKSRTDLYDAHVENIQTSNLSSLATQLGIETTISGDLTIDAVSKFTNSLMIDSESTVNGLAIFNNTTQFKGPLYSDDKFYVEDLKTHHGFMSNLSVQYLSVENALNINFDLLELDNVMIDKLRVHNLTNDNTHSIYAHSEQHSIDELYANNTYNSNIYGNNAYLSNVQSKYTKSFESHIQYLSSSNASFKSSEISYLRSINSSNDEMNIYNAYIRNEYSSNAFINKGRVKDLSTSNIESLKASFSNLHANYGDLYSLKIKEFANIHNLYTDNNFVNVQNTETLNADNIQGPGFIVNTSNVDINNLHVDKLFADDSDIQRQTVQTQDVKTAIIQTSHLENAYIQTSSTINATFSNIVVDDANIANFKVGAITISNLNATGESVFNSDVTMCNNVDFKGPLKTNGNFTVDGSNNYFNNVNLTSTKIYGSMDVKTTPNFEKNISVQGVHYGSRIGLRPYKESLSVAFKIDMTNVLAINRITGTKIFGKDDQIGLNGGKGVLEIQKYANALVQLDRGMETFTLKIVPENITNDLIGIGGKITFLEHGIYGRKLNYEGPIVFEKSNNGNKTFKSPDTYGGYVIDVLEYTIVSKNKISAKYYNKQIVKAKIPGDNQNTWFIFFYTNILYLQDIAIQENTTVLLMTKVPFNVSNSHNIEFSDLHVSDSAYERALLLSINDKGDVQDALRIVETGYRNDIIKDVQISYNGNRLSWSTNFEYDAQENLIKIDIKDTESNVLRSLEPNPDYVNQQISIVVFQSSLLQIQAIHIFRDSIIQDICVDNNTHTLILVNPTFDQNPLNFITFENENGDKQTISIHDDNNDCQLLVKFTQFGVFRWKVSLNGYVIEQDVDKNSNSLLLGKTNKPKWSIKDSKLINNVQFNFEESEGKQIVFVVKVNETGIENNSEFAWIVHVVNKRDLYPNSIATLNNNDCVFSFSGFGNEDLNFYDSQNNKSDQDGKLSQLDVIESSWNKYLCFANFDSVGLHKWTFFHSYVSDTSDIVAANDGGFFITVLPMRENETDEKESSILFNSSDDKVFNATTYMENNNKYSGEVCMIHKMDKKGNLLWTIILENMSQNVPAYKFENVKVNSTIDGGVIVSSSGNSEESDTALEAKITDAVGTISTAINFFTFKTTSLGIFEKDICTLAKNKVDVNKLTFTTNFYCQSQK